MNVNQVLVIPASDDEALRVVAVTPAHDTFVDLVDDINTDTVFLADADAVVKVAANGKSLASHQPNPRATQLVERFLPGFAKRDRVEGPAVFVGLDAEGDLSDVPTEVVEFASSLFGVSETPG